MFLFVFIKQLLNHTVNLESKQFKKKIKGELSPPFIYLFIASGSGTDILFGKDFLFSIIFGNFTVSRNGLLMFFFHIAYSFSYWFQEIICGQACFVIFVSM